MARVAKTRGSIGAQGDVTRGRSKWSTEMGSVIVLTEMGSVIVLTEMGSVKVLTEMGSVLVLTVSEVGKTMQSSF